MHMPDLSDEELDALFRQGAEGYPEELNLGAWARMEQKLDEARIQQLANRKVARLFAAEIGIVAVLLLIWGGYREYQPADAAPAAVTEVAATPLQGVAGAPAAASAQGVTAAADTKLQPAAPEAVVAASSTVATAPDAPASAANGMATATPAPAAAAASPTAAGPRRKTRPVLPLALAASHDEPNAPASAEESGTARPASTRRRRRASVAPVLVAASRPKSTAGNVAHAAAMETGAAARQVTAPVATNTTPVADAATAGNTSAGSTLHNQSLDTPAGTLASVVTTAAVGAGNAGGTVKAGTESGAATALPPAVTGAVATAAPASNGTTNASTQAETTAAAGAAAETSAAKLAADALQSVSTTLLTDELAPLPSPLPADSIVRRRPRPFVPSRLFITGLYAPELSTVRGAGATRVGHSAGIQIEYIVLPRLRLDVGLLTSMKYYRAEAKDYTAPRPPMYPIDHVDATCRITDIPVNLRYDAWQRVRYRAFASVGLSSLLMRDEQYHYTYYGTTYTRNWQVKKGSQHLFSVLNLAAGLERQLSPRWSVQAEPYVKLPLGGVGAGKVRLSSGGVFFGLKYGL